MESTRRRDVQLLALKSLNFITRSTGHSVNQQFYWSLGSDHKWRGASSHEAELRALGKILRDKHYHKDKKFSEHWYVNLTPRSDAFLLGEFAQNLKKGKIVLNQGWKFGHLILETITAYRGTNCYLVSEWNTTKIKPFNLPMVKWRRIPKE